MFHPDCWKIPGIERLKFLLSHLLNVLGFWFVNVLTDKSSSIYTRANFLASSHYLRGHKQER